MELRPYQIECVNLAIEAICDGKNPLIELPTGAGKSIVHAEIINQLMQIAPHTRVLALTHVKELIQQNAEKLWKLCPDHSIGIFSAGLGKKVIKKITVGGVQSVYKKLDSFPAPNIITIDECHLLPPDGNGMYRKVLEAFPNARILGMTATPWRSRTGMLHQGEGAIFNHLIKNAPITRLIAEGYLSPIHTKHPQIQADMTGVRTVNGDFEKTETEKRLMAVTEKAVAHFMLAAKDRKSILIFTTGLRHSEMVKALLPGSEIVTGETPPMIRDNLIRRFRAGKLRHLINMNVLTTGFDAPGVDCIVLLRATQSPGLYMQMVGRGTRIADGKKDCLLLDYGQNVSRFGPIDSVSVMSRSPGDKAEALAPPFKVCPNCDTVMHPTVKFCPECNHEFVGQVPIFANATILPVLTAPVEYDVRHVVYKKHEKEDKPPSMRVDYHCGDDGVFRISEWVPFESPKGRGIAVSWWNKRSQGCSTPQTTDDALELSLYLQVPAKIKVLKEGKFYRVLGVVEWKPYEQPEEMPF